jgi:alpha-glucoside transport system substrate-binding protein
MPKSSQQNLKNDNSATLQWRVAPLLLCGLSLSLVTACSQDPQATGGGSGGGGTGTVTILGAVVGSQLEDLRAALAPFEEQTGIRIIYEGSDAFTTLLPIRVDSGDAPDVALFPQPGLMTEFIANGQMVPITDLVEQEELTAAFPEDWLALATFDDQLYGVWLRAAVKSLVWYNPQQFAAEGYTVPTTWDEMMALSDRMVADGYTPWCLGVAAGDATGWVGTDWVEDIMLRTAGPEVYDQWVTNELPFNSPPVQKAFAIFGEIARNPEYVPGGGVGALSTPFGDAIHGLFTEPPRCMLHRQGNFISAFIPEGVDVSKQVDIFPLPPIDPQFGLPILVGGDLFGVFNATPEAKALVEYLLTPTPHEIWAARGGFLSPHRQVPPEVYPDELTQRQAEILISADVLRFDASDLMPSTVGTGTFWSGSVDYIAGGDLNRVLNRIQESWPDPEEGVY